jgi:hypothetical protein
MHRVIFLFAFVVITAVALPASETLAAGKQKSQRPLQFLKITMKHVTVSNRQSNEPGNTNQRALQTLQARPTTQSRR